MASLTRAAAVFVATGTLLLTGSPAQAQGAWTTVPSPNEPGNNILLARTPPILGTSGRSGG
jgi:hypothetical protein